MQKGMENQNKKQKTRGNERMPKKTVCFFPFEYTGTLYTGNSSGKCLLNDFISTQLHFACCNKGKPISN